MKKNGLVLCGKAKAVPLGQLLRNNVQNHHKLMALWALLEEPLVAFL